MQLKTLSSFPVSFLKRDDVVTAPTPILVLPFLVTALCLDVCLHGVEAIHDAGHQPKAAAISPRALAGALILTPARPFFSYQRKKKSKHHGSHSLAPTDGTVSTHGVLVSIQMHESLPAYLAIPGTRSGSLSCEPPAAERCRWAGAFSFSAEAGWFPSDRLRQRSRSRTTRVAGMIDLSGARAAGRVSEEHDRSTRSGFGPDRSAWGSRRGCQKGLPR